MSAEDLHVKCQLSALGTREQSAYRTEIKGPAQHMLALDTCENDST